MFSWTLLTALRRRWYLLLLSLLVTAAATYLVVDRVPPTYELRADVVLLPPDALLEEGENPFLALGGLNQALDVLVRAFPPELRQEVHDTTGAEFEVVRDPGASGPIMLVTATAPTPSGVDQALGAVLDATPRILEGIQDDTDVPAEDQIISMVLYQEVTPERSLTPTLRAGVLVGGVSLLAGVLAIAAVDGLLLRRRGRPAADAPAPTA
ncbi:hypothetical protein [Ornithinimicrobium avium]|uniref:Polysaccharide chain length determinant N-terminal domain-containing protein n=1 Tax=Ornithinimicrobium avium TaxID=2283195 RepID=A0A345NMZ0_9MICO|nr:hypothetical protein [Ornithinimicrobium avium]AXH96398.1 hypothetical protein DV701_09960 [Ornithinimicrobium avium]